jgi:DNA-binding PadR family transcriptional regulator
MALKRAFAGDPRSFLPLTPLACHVLLALADVGMHGYGIIREVSERTDGLIQLRSGTLYTLLHRLESEGLILESDARPDPDEDDERRRYYALTPLGRAVLEADLRRLESAVGEARHKRVLPKAGRA